MGNGGIRKEGVGEQVATPQSIIEGVSSFGRRIGKDFAISYRISPTEAGTLLKGPDVRSSVAREIRELRRMVDAGRSTQALRTHADNWRGHVELFIYG